jgi:hypothetical protein
LSPEPLFTGQRVLSEKAVMSKIKQGARSRPENIGAKLFAGLM